MTDTELTTRAEKAAARLADLSECLWWDWGFEENHTHKADRDVLDEASTVIEDLLAALRSRS